jgi:hypothetical protein
MRLEWRDTTFLGGASLRTSITEDETRELQRLAEGKRVLEIGTGFGYSAIAMALGGAAVVDTVDPHTYLTRNHPNDGPRAAESEQVLHENLRAYDISNINVHVFRSDQILSRLQKGYDLVFIDADHGDDSVRHDLDVALKMLAGNGVIACHDYDEETCPGIRNALVEHFSGGSYHVIDTLYVREVEGEPVILPVEQPLVSVITATWGRPRTIVEHAVNSVKSQDYPNIEHLIVVDGQADSLNKVLEQHDYHLAGKYRYVNLGRNWTQPFENGSNGAIARMVGSYLAAGEYVTYLDDDNDWDPDHISSMVKRIEEGPFDIVISDIKGYNQWQGNAVVGGVDTSSFMHRAHLLQYTSWKPDGYCCDGYLVTRWVNDFNCSWGRKEGATVTLTGQRRGVPE